MGYLSNGNGFASGFGSSTRLSPANSVVKTQEDLTRFRERQNQNQIQLNVQRAQQGGILNKYQEGGQLDSKQSSSQEKEK